uniref:Uncharacterized protein n=2 Tax=Sphaerodactylus townsendi TaxID=933632 RepID=A0ACB8F329_9SAUR
MEDDGGGDPDTAVLTLSHFSRPPFLSFGTVGVGTSRTRRLALENPNAEPILVAVWRPPPASKGFAVEQLRCLIQPRERVFISIVWMPLEEGRVRELITFVVNGVVKHQAVLLGSAEQPVKKKRSLWESIKKRSTAQQPQYKKRQSRIKNVNKTFQVSEKTNSVRSPLQCCENLEESRCSASPEGDSLILENKMPLSPISPTLQENRNVTCTPLSMRSTVYSILEKVDDDVLPKAIKETFTIMPMKTKLESAHIVQPIEAQNSNTNSCDTPEQLKRLHITSDHKRILSPDSLPSLGVGALILSPDQFLKENQIAVEPVLQVCEPVLPSDLEPGVSEYFPPKKEKKVLQTVTFSAEPQFQHKAFNVTRNRELSVFHYENCEQHLSFPAHTAKHQVCQFQKQEPLKRPLLSSTVIKSKQGPLEGKGPQMLKSKSRKCLSNAIQQCVDKVPESRKIERLPNLPVIESLTCVVSSDKVEKASLCSESSSHNRKRKSGEFLEEINSGSKKYMGNVDTKKLSMSCELNEKPTDLKTSGPKSANREKQSQKKRVGFLSQKSRSARKTSKKMVPVAQSQLTFLKPFKTDLPRHPMPFVAKNMFYDERWKEKQQRGFTWWLNFVLTPDDFTVKTDTSHVNAASLILGIEAHHKCSVPKAPTKEEVSLRAYSARCKLNKLRSSACRLFTHNAMVKAIKRLEVEIEAKHLLVRKDRHLWKDIGQRQKILNWLLCYNPLWLRMGLETVYGELIALENNSDVTGLAMFILTRLLWNPDIAAEYRHPAVPHLYRDGHEEALSKFTLKKILLLVCFLDHAKSSRIIDHDPCLFCRNAAFKSSRDILLAFSRDFLSGEGDLSRHLGFLGLPVNHVQTPLDEFDFSVVNLATDLQCGIRLVRTLELLSKNWSLSKKLRVPAMSRLQKIHNVNIALQVLKDHGIQLKDEYGSGIDAKDIVDRHREKTLALLWKIVFAFQVNVFLDLNQLKDEIDFLKNLHDAQVKMAALESSVTVKGRKDSSCFYSSESCSENVKLLMDWVNAVCVFYGIQVENFTVSFSDGRILCYLIHHYHPCYMPLEAICQRTTQTIECTKSGTLALNSSSESDDSLSLLNKPFGQAVSTSALYKELLDNEKKNFQLVNAAVSDLGGVPAMIHHVDMSNTIPDEKVVITYVSFLCSRLLAVCKEIRAARLIQSAWRKHRLKKELAQNIKQILNATVVIQKHWRRCLAQKELQKFIKAKREETERVSSVVIQKYWRGYCARRKYLQLRYNTVLMQARIRMLLSLAAYKKIIWAAVTIQRRWRASLKAKNDYQRYQNLKVSTFVIQSAFRRWKTCKIKQKIEAELLLQEAELAEKTRAAVLIQSWYRMIRDRNSFFCVRRSVIKIQAWFRCILAKFIYKQKKAGILAIQKCYRAYRLGKTERETYLQRRAAIIVLQAAFRGMKARLLFKQVRAVCIIQSFWQMRRERQRFLQVKHFVIVVQSHVRKQQQLKRFRAIKDAASVIQARYRAYRASKKAITSYHELRRAAVILQSAFRAKQARQKVNMLKSIIKIQSCFRAYVARKRFLNFKLAAVKIQAFIKMRQSHKHYCALREAAIYVQRRYRSQKEASQLREEYAKLRRACVKVQAVVRGHHTRKWMKRRQEAAVVLQAQYRMKRERQHYLSLCRASTVIQMHYRAYREGTCQREIFLQLKKATICLQAACRGYRLRKTLQRENEAALIIQTAFRTHAARRRHQTMIQASLVIQRWYRASKATSEIQQSFFRTKAAVITLQAASRGWLARKRIQEQHAAAIVIQSALRKYKALKNFTTTRNAALTLQRRYRALMSCREQRQAYILFRTCIIQLQAVWRGSVMREQIKRQHQGAVVIQSYYRMHNSRAKFKSLRLATVSIQRRYRAAVLANSQRQEYLALREATVKIQAVYRGVRTRRNVQGMHHAAVCIQAIFKMHQAYAKYQALKLATAVIQVRYRAVCRRRQEQAKYQELREASFILQSADRGMKVRQELKTLHFSSVTIQRKYRATVLAKDQRNEYLCFHQSAIIVQSAFRGMLVRKRVNQMHAAATIIQATIRMYIMRNRYRAVKLASVIIQWHYRSYKEAKNMRGLYLKQRHSAVVLQAAYRGMKTRCTLKKEHIAAVVIQSNFRMHRQCCSYRKMQWAAIVIQTKFRARCLRKLAVQQHSTDRAATSLPMASCTTKEASPQTRHHAALVIQRSFKLWRDRRKIQSYCHVAMDSKTIQYRTAAVTLQTLSRGNEAGVQYQKYRKAAIVIQQYFRSFLAVRRQRRIYLRTLRSIIVMQATVRGFLERQRLRQIKSAVKMQISGQKQQSSLLRFTAGAYYHLAAVRIQRAYRIHLLWKHEQMQLASVLYIQRWYRAKIQRREFLQHREKIVKIQRMVRKRMKCKSAGSGKIQKGVSQRTMNNGITKFQALWRGYLWRKKTDTDETRALRDSLVMATKESKEEMKLCNRTALAIDRLLKYKHFSYILAALKDLEVVTRLSPVCCESMAQTEAVSTIFTLIRSCNRSVPCMDVIKYSVQILLNLSKYERTTQTVYSVENSIDTLLDLLQMYREKAGDKISGKGGSIFTKVCSLLALLVKDSTRASEIRSNPQVIARLRSLFRLISRKHEMDAQRTLAQQKTSAFRNGRIPVLVTPVRTKIISRQRPDWVLGKDNMKEIVDPLQAIQMTMDTLGISFY